MLFTIEYNFFLLNAEGANRYASLVHFRYMPCGYAFSAVRAKQDSMILRKINRPFDNSVVVHLNKFAFTYFLIICDEAFTISTTDFQDVTATDFFALWVFIYFHIISSYFNTIRAAQRNTNTASCTFLNVHVNPRAKRFTGIFNP